MKEKRNIHLKVQEMCDCYATTDPLKEMSKIKGDSDQSEAAEKWLALAALHGVNNNAKEISIRRSKDGKIKVTAQYRESELPSPGSKIGKKIMSAVRERKSRPARAAACHSVTRFRITGISGQMKSSSTRRVKSSSGG